MDSGLLWNFWLISNWNLFQSIFFIVDFAGLKSNVKETGQWSDSVSEVSTLISFILWIRLSEHITKSIIFELFLEVGFMPFIIERLCWSLITSSAFPLLFVPLQCHKVFVAFKSPTHIILLFWDLKIESTNEKLVLLCGCVYELRIVIFHCMLLFRLLCIRSRLSILI